MDINSQEAFDIAQLLKGMADGIEQQASASVIDYNLQASANHMRSIVEILHGRMAKYEELVKTSRSDETRMEYAMRLMELAFVLKLAEAHYQIESQVVEMAHHMLVGE